MRASGGYRLWALFEKKVTRTHVLCTSHPLLSEANTKQLLLTHGDCLKSNEF
jgi:hypothetical protein